LLDPFTTVTKQYLFRLQLNRKQCRIHTYIERGDKAMNGICCVLRCLPRPLENYPVFAAWLHFREYGATTILVVWFADHEAKIGSSLTDISIIKW
jgi:hypothetical protein